MRERERDREDKVEVALIGGAFSNNTIMYRDGLLRTAPTSNGRFPHTGEWAIVHSPRRMG
jgi:hypothetical protein